MPIRNTEGELMSMHGPDEGPVFTLVGGPTGERVEIKVTNPPYGKRHIVPDGADVLVRYDPMRSPNSRANPFLRDIQNN